eukprot:4616721-Pleurochrysis_carterae.AAC.7
MSNSDQVIRTTSSSASNSRAAWIPSTGVAQQLLKQRSSPSSVYDLLVAQVLAAFCMRIAAHKLMKWDAIVFVFACKCKAQVEQPYDYHAKRLFDRASIGGKERGTFLSS